MSTFRGRKAQLGLKFRKKDFIGLEPGLEGWAGFEQVDGKKGDPGR